MVSGLCPKILTNHTSKFQGQNFSQAVHWVCVCESPKVQTPPSAFILPWSCKVIQNAMEGSPFNDPFSITSERPLLANLPIDVTVTVYLF